MQSEMEQCADYYQTLVLAIIIWFALLNSLIMYGWFARLCMPRLLQNADSLDIARNVMVSRTYARKDVIGTIQNE